LFFDDLLGVEVSARKRKTQTDNFEEMQVDKWIFCEMLLTFLMKYPNEV